MTFRVPTSIGHGKADALESELSEEISRYRVDVVTHDVAEAVMSIGGWMFDMAMAGWDVRTLTADNADDRPLRILGCAAVASATHLRSDGPANIIAVSGDLLAADSQVRNHVVAALGRRDSEVMIWGTKWPELPETVGKTEHRLSRAALVFKAEALTAAGASRTSCENAENFWGYPSSVPRPANVTSLVGAQLRATGSDPYTA
jgi:hypothetical protein